MADDYEAKTGMQWTQALLHYQVFEIVVNALKAAKDIDSKEEIAAAIKAGVLDTLVGLVDFSKGPMPNVSKTPLTEGQWFPRTKWKYDLVLVNNTTAPMVRCRPRFSLSARSRGLTPGAAGVDLSRGGDRVSTEPETERPWSRGCPYPVRYEAETEVSFDVVVLGGGLAGCFAAIAAARKGASVTLVDKAATRRSGCVGAGLDHWQEIHIPGVTRYRRSNSPKPAGRTTTAISVKR